MHPLLRPKYLVGTLLALSAVLLTAALGFWQLDRLAERRAGNVLRAEQREAAPVMLPSAEMPDTGWFERPARAHGRFVSEPVVLLVNRSYQGQGGVEVISPFRMENGAWLLVNRGWVPQSQRDTIPPPPAEALELEGYLSVVDDDFEAQPEGLAQNLWLRLDAERIGRYLAETDSRFEAAPVLPYGLVLTVPHEGAPPPKPRSLPALDDGPHLSYAIQWFFIATIFLVGWPVFLWRELRHSRRKSSAGV